MQNTKRSSCHSIQVSRKPLTTMALALATTMGLTLSFSAQAATITVTSASDAAAPAGGCSLRGAVMAVNSGSNAHGCAATGVYGSDDTILFASTLTGSTITLTGEIEIQKSLTINGGSANAVTLDADHATNIFYVNGGTKLVIDGMVLKNGHFDFGGAIFVGQMDRGTEQPVLTTHDLFIRNSTFSGNSSGQFGGAIHSWTSATIENSTFNDNTTGTGGGGAIFSEGLITISNSRFFNNKTWGDEAWGGAARGTDITVSGSTFDHNEAYEGGALATSLYHLQTTGTVSVSNSTFNGNEAGLGGAIMAVNTNIENSTFIDNRAGVAGGAIYAVHTLNVAYVTFLNNISYWDAAPYGATLFFAEGASASIKNSLIAGYSDALTSPHCAAGSGGATLNNSNNIEWRNGSNESSCNSTNPVLVPDGMSLEQIVSTTLADNGGPTQTLALPAGSPAIDAGDPAVTATADQRGQARPQGSGPDLGAFEVASSSGTTTGVNVTTQVVGGVTLTTINGQLVSSPEHVGMNTATFVFVNIASTDSWLLLNPETGWHPWVDCGSSAFSYSFGAMPWVTDIALFYNGDLSPFHGWPVLFGYGVGDTKEAACADMFNNARYTHVTTL